MQTFRESLLSRQQHRAGLARTHVGNGVLVDGPAADLLARQISSDIPKIAAVHHSSIPWEAFSPACARRAASLLCSNARERCSRERIVPTAQPVTAAASA